MPFNSEIAAIVLDEVDRAERKFPPFRSAHEGYAILLEEMDELWEAVRLKQGSAERMERMRIEALQVAAMAFRFYKDIIQAQNNQ